MCTVDEIAAKARFKVRDFGIYFEVPYTAAPVYSLRLPHPLVDQSLFTMWTPDGVEYAATNYTIDQRNGIVKIKDTTTLPDGVGCSGYYYEWFLNEDLQYAASVTYNQHLYNKDNADDGSDFKPVECDAIATGAVSQAMWSLLAEFATDIDVSTPEGMMIPAHQRYQQMWQMATMYTQMYKDEAAMLGVGLDRFEQFTLRRIAYLTNRLVPLFKPREIDDPRMPRRVFLPVPDGTLESDDAVVVPMPDQPGIAYGGWLPIGTSGSP